MHQGIFLATPESCCCGVKGAMDNDKQTNLPMPLNLTGPASGVTWFADTQYCLTFPGETHTS